MDLSEIDSLLVCLSSSMTNEEDMHGISDDLKCFESMDDRHNLSSLLMMYILII